MRARVRSTAVVAGLFLAGWFLAEGATLEDRKNEWAFSLDSLDVNDVGTFSSYAFDWSHIFNRGYLQLGVEASGFRDDPDVGPKTDGSSVGPLIVWNWTPRKERATGFLFATLQGVGGDAGDSFDTFESAGVGVKAFVGNSAAVLVTYSADRFTGKNGVGDQDQSRLSVGIALFSQHRK